MSEIEQDPYHQYVETCNAFAKQIERGGNRLAKNVVVCLIASDPLDESHFELTLKDRRPLFNLPPGKSAFIYFTDSLVAASKIILNREPKATDTIFETSTKQLKQVGWVAHYCRTSQHPLHVRLFPSVMLHNPDLDQFLPNDITTMLEANIWRPIYNDIPQNQAVSKEESIDKDGSA